MWYDVKWNLTYYPSKPNFSFLKRPLTLEITLQSALWLTKLNWTRRLCTLERTSWLIKPVLWEQGFRFALPAFWPWARGLFCVGVYSPPGISFGSKSDTPRCSLRAIWLPLLSNVLGSGQLHEWGVFPLPQIFRFAHLSDQTSQLSYLIIRGELLDVSYGGKDSRRVNWTDSLNG